MKPRRHLGSFGPASTFVHGRRTLFAPTVRRMIEKTLSLIYWVKYGRNCYN
ncbi:hypothetical protein HMPREF9440_01251 [Sutterella parvirubra YIT 11816]|uniref:Uncharacterized protein n=1 Tax=Sutterella parvirubra YIT 11816 TaxID=762967 RepID=H3KET7_9BURK|nr:hypothetical protein HMPREF9440_01251 [Sutterella parvirubra YIT 11816]